MEFKQLSYNLKELDEKKGVVTAYANAYNFKDSDGDISAFGSFEKTVIENFKRIRVLKDHNPTMMIGVPLTIDTKDTYGLLTTTQFNMNKPLGKDMFTDVKLMHENNLNAELSIGYNVLQRDQKNKSIITEYKLMEYSFLSSWGANELSTVQGIKSIKSHYGFMELLTKAYNLDYSDERLRGIESLLKMASMEMDGEDNDSKFVNMMIPHHEAAIKMAKKYESLLKNNTLVKMSKDIITSQSKEIEIMKALSKKSLETDTLNEPLILDALKSFSQSLNFK
jgi:HK97 family phage prohead protease